ncbi:hypothetical protein HL653_11755 [Sphingomonas sp. AP4-R1]|uniref:hypothetical protein n=1 Tax=Sphingomonas sp. AP4-R1 TaxID=2735134 RepID=UPI0014934827|nr:hypothetical protein [Sphingomonas sp. AP4-R1]QJU58361.1 hypothetical protein HL653_11755 [Sphingomonas sp. AP4-R1]
MMLMGLPFTALVQEPFAKLGHLIGYWDDAFASPVIATVLTALSFLLLLLISTLEWSLIWAACGIDALFGDRTISPPPFGYVAIKVAGAIAGVAALTSASLFAIKPLNDPVWRWIDTAGLVPTILMLTLGAALMLGYNRKTKVAQSCGEQIYGSRGKATAYQLGTLMLLLFAGWAFVHFQPSRTR